MIAAAVLGFTLPALVLVVFILFVPPDSARQRHAPTPAPARVVPR